MAEKKTSLHWFPTDAAKELTDPVALRMPPEQFGGYWWLRLIAWGDGSKEPSLPSDSESLAFLSRLGDRWKTFGPLIRAQFEERDGRFYHPGWTAQWHEQQAKYAAAAGKGGRGGHRKAANARQSKQGSSSATAQLETPQEQRVRVSGKPVPLSSALAELQPSSSSALALEGSVLQNLPPGGASFGPPAGGADMQYELAIGAKVEEYRRDHPGEAAALETDVRAELRVSRNRLLTRDEERRVHVRMIERLRDLDRAQGGDQ